VILAEIERATRGPPLLQVAVEGRGDRAVVVRLPLPVKEADKLLEGLGTNDLAVDVLWSRPPIVFVGARNVDRWLVAPGEIAGRGEWTPSEALKVLAGGSLGPPVRAELGAVNAWHSVGPVGS
jgi:hypothetical protein